MKKKKYVILNHSAYLALHQLAIRYNKEFTFMSNYQWAILDRIGTDSINVLCLICNQNIKGIVSEHGLHHLKEHNLLSFL